MSWPSAPALTMVNATRILPTVSSLIASVPQDSVDLGAKMRIFGATRSTVRMVEHVWLLANQHSAYGTPSPVDSDS